ncbi:MAG: hypothetical protein M3442_05160, partial [Chloroflexota bacterium]|nr:hypothetical protein [Chloroflexota bacterium]
MSPRGLRLGLFAAGVRLAEGLPAPLLYRLARVVAHLLSALPTPPRRRLRQNLAVVLGVPPASPLLRPFVQGAYRTQVANYVDLLRARRITPDEVTSRVAPPGEPTAGPSHAASVADEASVA